jgi:hypothetical protein
MLDRLEGTGPSPRAAWVGSPTPDDLRRVVELCYDALAPCADADWTVRAGSLDWSCRETLEHLCGLAYAPQLATRATGFSPLSFQVTPGAPIGRLLLTMRASSAILAEVARAAPPSARAFHPAGMADPSGWVAMGMDELLIHTNDIAAGLRVPFEIDRHLAQLVLDRLFPWSPAGAEPVPALLWANGRADLPAVSNPGSAWLWYCAPLAEWNGSVPQWDPTTNQPVARPNEP